MKKSQYPAIAAAVCGALTVGVVISAQMIAGPVSSAMSGLAGASNTLAATAQAQTVASGLAQRVESARRGASSAMWVRYETDSARRIHGMCQDNGWGGSGEIDLDSIDRRGARSKEDESEPGRIAIYLKLEKQAVSELEVFGSGCTVKASSSTLTDLGSAGAAESVALLRGLMPSGVSASANGKLAKKIVFATAIHATPDADAALQTWSGDAWPTAVQRDAVFWMGSARGAAGFAGLQKVIRDSTNAELRKHAVFAISLHRGDEGTTELLRLAKSDDQREVRKAAVFWLSQRASKAAVNGLEEIVEREPDAKLREHAVFALSQLPDDEGVPKLIALAKTHRDAGVRKKAIFWLSQKSDPRVLSFLEEVLVGKSN